MVWMFRNQPSYRSKVSLPLCYQGCSDSIRKLAGGTSRFLPAFEHFLPLDIEAIQQLACAQRLQVAEQRQRGRQRLRLDGERTCPDCNVDLCRINLLPCPAQERLNVGGEVR